MKQQKSRSSIAYISFRQNQLLMYLFIVVFACIYTSNTQAIIEGTPVVTLDGLVLVEYLDIGSIVLGHDLNGQVLSTPITKVETSTIDTIYVIVTNKGPISASPEQLFYDPTILTWIKASQIIPQQTLFCIDGNLCYCLAINSYDHHTKNYEFCVEYPYSLFISDAQVLIHNSPCVMPVIAVKRIASLH